MASNAIRSAVLELTRVTEQSAILASTIAGFGAEGGRQRESSRAIRSATLRRHMLGAFLNCLKHSLCCRAQVVFPDPVWMGFPDSRDQQNKTFTKLWGESHTSRLGSLPVHEGWPLCDVPVTDGKSRSTLGTLRFMDSGKHRSITELELARPFAGSIEAMRVGPSASPWDLELVISPIDGLRDLLQGHGDGSTSLLVGGPAGGSFRLPEELTADAEAGPRWVFTFVSGRAEVTQLLRGRLAETVNRTDGPLPMARVHEFVEGLNELRALLNSDPKESRIEATGADQLSPRPLALVVPTICTVRPLRRPEGTPPLRAVFRATGFRVRTFLGSPVAAAIAALIPSNGIHAFCGVVRHPTAIQLAVAARAFGGELLAVPLRLNAAQAGVRTEPEPLCMPQTRLLDSSAFLATDQTFLVMTGISRHTVLRDVRFSPEGTVSTQTMAANCHSRSVRVIDHSRDLARDHLCSIKADGRLRPAIEIITEFQSQFKSR